jgi:superfamily II DNA/RNA helicase
VVNLSCPDDEKTYLHRIGRTGRAGATGIAVTLVDWNDLARWKMINDALGLPFADPPETYSSSEHFFHDLGIPPGTKGKLPRDERTRAGLGAEEVDDDGEGRGTSGSRQRRRTRRGSGTRGSQGGQRGRAAARGGESTNGTSATETPATRPRTRTRSRTRRGQPIDKQTASE